ncbi:isoleucine--tRNA ligase [Desulfovibrio intestinalis]|uniref:Isoleucine--tRNA ligase n=1 Tax=Desulfovibrio intestinalis TaxID=58621 RepID=A0A7W8C5H0_9BACT|nr:isoleucine--tRNA ligase [Desulfovibrio intestinalis]MBB5144759.1 isoleucyl-tRNA synthetase [Desulfovibrio intestinalis]
MSDYKKTLNLPQTAFPMKANLAQREPETLKKWEAMNACGIMVEASGSKGSYILHDGPPYANGHIHMGTALNKILKDIIVKSRNMAGYTSRYVPGWDCHGLPIEHKVEQELKEKKKTLPAHVVRKLCREYASKWIDVQRKEFKRLGVLGNWEDPYMSMKPAYEAATADELANFVATGGVVRSKKPIHWCCSCHTALAEAEVEYYDHTSPSVYVRFSLPDEGLKKVFAAADPSRANVVIWTTTPWTLPDNMGVCLHPEFTYALVEAAGSQYILAEELLESCAAAFGWSDYTILDRAPGAKLEGLKARHPFYDRDSLVILGQHVTLEAGTGCVHTAPGHGREDYDVGLKYGLEVYSPMDDAGRFLPSVEFFAGLNVFEANPKVIEKLEEVGALLQKSKIKHSYPHCWRCKEPVIFRATTQWFISMEKNDLRTRALKAIDDEVCWIPAWGRERIHNMVEFRPDWCISRQRQWGVPIMALLCEDCGEAWNDPAWMHEMAARFANHPTGCDYWYEAELKDIVPEGLACPHCGGNHWKRETDILDVWFDSGTSFAAVLEKRPELGFPADLYLEGSDQHRGWFHSSLLVSEGTRNRAPYRSVLTHGYVVDGDGRKMSKSIGNVIAPQELIEKFGAEIVRLWVSSVEYREDIRISDEILGRLVDAYRRIRNTCRFILGNLNDISAQDLLPLDKLEPLDRFALDVAGRVHERVQQAYMDFDFHKVYHTLHNYCVTDLSSVYLDILKDRLYASAPASQERRSAQTALWHILCLLLRDMAPVLSFTAEEIFSHLPESLRGPEPTVFALPALEAAPYLFDEGTRDDWNVLLAVRGAVTKAIEPMRREGIIGHSLDTRITLFVADELRQRLEGLHTDLRAVCIVSQLQLEALDRAPQAAYQDEEIAGLAIGVEKARGEKCERCWIYSTDLGTDPEHPALCPRCTAVIKGMES